MDKTRKRLDDMRFKAFRTNKKEDVDAFFRELSHLFQNFKIVTVEEAKEAGATGWPFD